MHVYNTALVIIGACCLVAGLTGRGVEFFNVRIPLLDRAWQQVGVGVVGVALFVLGVVPPANETPVAKPTPTVDGIPTAPPTLPPSFDPPTVPISSSAPPTSSCAKALSITAPENGTKVSNGNSGIEVDITACGLQQGQAGWLFDYDTGDGTYNLDGNGGPIVTSNGSIPFQDQPIGNQGDVNKDTKITLVLADASCTQALNQMNLQNANTGPTHLPAGCQIMQQVDVYVTYP